MIQHYCTHNNKDKTLNGKLFQFFFTGAHGSGLFLEPFSDVVFFTLKKVRIRIQLLYIIGLTKISLAKDPFDNEKIFTWTYTVNVGINF